MRIYHSTSYITQGSVELPHGVDYLSSSGPESFDIAIAEAKSPPTKLTVPFVSEADFTIFCVDRVQKQKQ